MYRIGSETADRDEHDRNPSPLQYGDPIEECRRCGAYATPEELKEGLCTECRSPEFCEALMPLEGFDDLDLVRCDDESTPSLERAACFRVLELDGSPFDVSALVDRLTLRGTVFA